MLTLIVLYTPPVFILVSCSVCSSTLKIEATNFSETSVDFQWATRCYIPEDRTPHNHRCENLKPYMSFGTCTMQTWTTRRHYGYMLVVYSCCSHLGHTASVKRFVLLQFLNLRHSVGLIGRVNSPSQGRYLTQTDIHASSGIQTHDPSVRTSEDCSCL
jgi:hypothetical protein